MQQSDQPVQIATKFGPCSLAIYSSVVSDALAGLKRLQSGTESLYQVHWPFSFFMSRNADERSCRRGEAGRKLWVSATTQPNRCGQAHQLLAARGVPLANQVRYSLLARQIETNGISKPPAS